MIPVLLNLPFLKIYTFGIFLVLAFFWSSFLLWKNIRLTSYKEDDMFDGVFVALFGALFVGRLVYVGLNFDNFGFNILKFLLINGYPGLSLYGCLLGGILFLYLFLRMKKMEFSSVVDGWASPLFIGLGIGKLGSFFSGVEVGTKTTFFLSLKYGGFDGLRHLTSFYEACFFFLSAFIAHRLFLEIRKEKFRQGFNFIFFLWYFSLVYFVFDKLKSNHLYLADVSLNMVVAGVFLLTLSFYLLYYLRSNFIKRLHFGKLFLKHETNTGNTQKTAKNS